MQDWNGYYYYFGEGQRCVVSFRASLCEPQNQFPSVGRRLIGFSLEEHIRPDGMPSPEAYARLKAIEDAARAAIPENLRCVHVGTHVYLGMRELLFQLHPDDVPVFERIAQQIEERFGGTKVVPYEGWQFFNDKIVPNEEARAHIGNRSVLEQLREHGAPMGEARPLDHTFVGPTDALAKVRETLQSDFGVQSPAVAGDSFTVQMTSTLAQDDVDRITRICRAIAKHHGARYDGWGTMV